MTDENTPTLQIESRYQLTPHDAEAAVAFAITMAPLFHPALCRFLILYGRDMLRATRDELAEVLNAEAPTRFVVYLDQARRSTPAR
jgi:hypothetical protein